MDVVIIGGSECMERQYCDLCTKHGCKAKAFCKFKNGMRDRVGKPDLMIPFTHTVSYKVAQYTLGSVGEDTCVVRSHMSSMSSLKDILVEHTV